MLGLRYRGPPSLPAWLREELSVGKLIRHSLGTENEPTRGPLRKKARIKEVPVEQGESLLEDVGSEDEEGSQYAEGYASNHREVDGDVGSQVIRDKALDEAVQLYHSTTRRVSRDRNEDEYSPEMSTAGEGGTETLDCTSQRQVPACKYCQGRPPMDAASSVSRYIKEEDEVIDLNHPGAGEHRPGEQAPRTGVLSVQAQTKGEAEGRLLLTSLSPTGDRFARRRLLGTMVQVNGQAVTALLDSGCEAKLVQSQRFADSHRIRYQPVSRMVGLPEGSQIASSRTKPLLLDVAVTTDDVSAIVVGMVAFDCILGLSWLRDVNPVVSWEGQKLLLPSDHGPIEIDASKEPCRSSTSEPTLLTVC
jgi:Retroviral aspartyl protease